MLGRLHDHFKPTRCPRTHAHVKFRHKSQIVVPPVGRGEVSCANGQPSQRSPPPHSEPGLRHPARPTLVTITPVGGLDKVPAFVLSIAVLMDVAAGGNQRIAQLAARGLLDGGRLVYLTEITGTAEADIEDLFHVGMPIQQVGVVPAGVVVGN